MNYKYSALDIFIIVSLLVLILTIRKYETNKNTLQTNQEIEVQFSGRPMLVHSSLWDDTLR